MKILSKYFLKEFLKFFFIILLVLTAILLVAEFFDKVNEFYSQKPPAYLVIEYLLLQCPKFLLFASPAASLLAILLTIGIAMKWKETVVIQASGLSLKKFFSSFIVTGIIISIFALLIGETIVPAATRKASWIRNHLILLKQSRITYQEGALWLKGRDSSLIRIRDFVGDENTILKISIFNFDNAFGLIRRTEAESARWVNNRWELDNVTVFDFSGNKTTKHKSIVSQAIEEPRIFKEEMRKPEEMNFFELYAYYKRLEKAGFKNLKYVVDLYGKLAYPMVNFVMVLFGIALVLNSRLGGGLKAAGLGIVVSICYWLIYSISASLGNTGAIPPWLAPWIGPVLFSTGGGYMYLRIRE